MADRTPELVRGPAFHLEGDGRWDVQELPLHVLRDAEFSGNLEIEGYPAVVFETSDGDQWAQKAPGTPSPKGDEALKEVLSLMAARVSGLASFSAPFLQMAARVASRRTSRVDLDEGQVRSAMGVLDELKAAKASLDKAVQHSRGFRTDPSLEWIADQLEAQQESLTGVASGIKDSLEYLARMDLET